MRRTIPADSTRRFLKLRAVGLRAGQVHLVTPCSPTSVWEESLSGQLPSSVVVTLLSVVNPKPRRAELVACSLQRDFVPGIF